VCMSACVSVIVCLCVRVNLETSSLALQLSSTPFCVIVALFQDDSFLPIKSAASRTICVCKSACVNVFMCACVPCVRVNLETSSLAVQLSSTRGLTLRRALVNSG